MIDDIRLFKCDVCGRTAGISGKFEGGMPPGWWTVCPECTKDWGTKLNERIKDAKTEKGEVNIDG